MQNGQGDAALPDGAVRAGAAVLQRCGGGLRARHRHHIPAARAAGTTSISSAGSDPDASRESACSSSFRRLNRRGWLCALHGHGSGAVGAASCVPAVGVAMCAVLIKGGSSLPCWHTGPGPVGFRLPGCAAAAGCHGADAARTVGICVAAAARGTQPCVVLNSAHVHDAVCTSFESRLISWIAYDDSLALRP